MKQVGPWAFPDNEQHLIDWMAAPKGYLVVNGRPSYQGKKQLRCMDFVPLKRRRVAIDVGGHIGLWSFNLAHWFEKVEAFEPVEVHRDCFEKNVFEAPDYRGSSVTMHPFALGEREDMVTIHTSSTSSGDSWVKGKGTIPMKTIDSFGFENVDFIKIDCEGYEEFVLRGGRETIGKHGPVICVEQKRDMASTRFGLKPLGAVKLLIGMGYKVVAEVSGDYILTRTP
jgi:FkbM family methyltransferase